MVPKASASLDISPGIKEPHPLERHHYNLNKFCQAEDMNYKSVENEILVMVNGASDFLKNCPQGEQL